MALHQGTTANGEPPRVPTRRPLGVTGINGPPPGWGVTQVGMDGVMTRPAGSVSSLIGTSGAGDPGTAVPGSTLGPVGVDRVAWPHPAVSAARVRRLAVVF